MLAAKKFSSPLQIVILLSNLITHRTKCDAGRACNPSLLTISTSLRMQFKAAALTTCVLHGDAFLLGKSCTTALAAISLTLSPFVELGHGKKKS
jgi:hypothetical protein